MEELQNLKGNLEGAGKVSKKFANGGIDILNIDRCS